VAILSADIYINIKCLSINNILEKEILGNSENCVSFCESHDLLCDVVKSSLDVLLLKNSSDLTL